MGNSTSSSGRHHDETVDGGHLTPQGVYTGVRDWNQAIVSQLICARKLAPFYRPLEEYEDSWDDDQILAARKEPPAVGPEGHETVTRIEAPLSYTPAKSSHNKRPSSVKEPSKPEAAMYRGAVECPICFLYYPPNINHSRCCDQAICTECFVQIKRIDPTTTHLVSEPAACPYCVQDNFGIVYTPPSWRSGLGSDTATFAWTDSAKALETSPPYPTHKRRQRSFSADSPDVVTIDHIRPDWEAKLAAVQAAVTRRANRRIVMRQVGDRLIPVGVTSGRVHALSPEEAAAEGVDTGAGSRRSRRRQQAPQNQNFEQFMGMGGQDLEELMLMEAMRLSMIDHEEHQRKEGEKKKKEAAAQARSDGKALSDTQSIPGPRPGASQTRSSGSTSLSSSPSVVTPLSSSPSAPRDSSSSQRSSFLSSAPQVGHSSWTPPPPGSYTSAHLNDEAISSWRRQTPSPTPFSTLSAALSSAATASAFLGNNPRDRVVNDNDAAANGEAIAGPSIPRILIGAGDSAQSHISTDISTKSQQPSYQSEIYHYDSTSGVSIDAPTIPSPTYDHLPSSPESSFDHEPLLDSAAASGERVTR